MDKFNAARRFPKLSDCSSVSSLLSTGEEYAKSFFKEGREENSLQQHWEGGYRRHYKAISAEEEVLRKRKE